MKLRTLLLGSALALSFTVSAPTPAKADPITASIVGFLGFTAGTTAAAIATFVVNSALYSGASWALGKASRALGKQKQSVQERQASVLQLTIGEVPREMVFGHTATGGSLIDAFNHGGQYGTDFVTRVIALADHAVDALYGIWVDDNFILFTANGTQPGFGGTLSVQFRNATGGPVSLPSVAAAGGWGSSDDLIGVTHIWVTYKFDDKVWTQGHPQFRFEMRGLRVYDPRKDPALGYTGPNPHDWENRATHQFTQNAALIRYAFARGIYTEGHQGDPDHLLVGRGLSAEEAPPDRVIAAANLCDEVVGPATLRYIAAGTVRASDDFIQVEEWFSAAMAGVIVQHEGGVEIEPGQAKATVATITDQDLVIGEAVTFSEFLPDTDGGRVNTVVPRYVSPAQRWADVSGPVRRDPADIIEDGGPREETLPLPFVTSADQADRCAEIRRLLSRLERRASITLPPNFSYLEEGDWIAWQSDRRHGGATVRYRIESWSRDKAWRMRLSLREIASSVYGVPDPIEDTLTPPPPPDPPNALSLSGVVVEAVVLGAPIEEGGPQTSQIPALRFTWDAPVDPAVLAIRAEVRVPETTAVSVTITNDIDTTSVFDPDAPPPTQTLIVTAGVGPDQLLEARLVPISASTRPVLASAWTEVATGPLIANDVAARADIEEVIREILRGFTGLTRDQLQEADRRLVEVRDLIARLRLVAETDPIAGAAILQESVLIQGEGGLTVAQIITTLRAADEDALAAVLNEQLTRITELSAESLARITALAEFEDNLAATDLALRDYADAVSAEATADLATLVQVADQIAASGLELRSYADDEILEATAGLATVGQVEDQASATQLLLTSYIDDEITTAYGSLAAQVEVDDLSALVALQVFALSDVEGRLEAGFGLATDVNGRISGLYGFNDGSVSTLDFLADTIRFYDGVTTQPLLALTGGRVIVNGPLVATESIEDDAVTEGVYAFTAGVQTLPGVTETTIQTVTLTTTGKPVAVDSNFLLKAWHPGAGDFSVNLFLYRDSTLIWDTTINAINGDQVAGWQTPQVLDEPGAGIWTYTQRVSLSRNDGFTNKDVQATGLRAREYKR